MKVFDENKYKNEWKKENMKSVKGMYKKDFVDEFKEACKVLGVSQSEIIRKAMQETIERAKNR